eukprot:1728898-Pyramimonas_sp.AAC.1
MFGKVNAHRWIVAPPGRRTKRSVKRSVRENRRRLVRHLSTSSRVHAARAPLYWTRREYMPRERRSIGRVESICRKTIRPFYWPFYSAILLAAVSSGRTRFPFRKRSTRLVPMSTVMVTWCQARSATGAPHSASVQISFGSQL